MTTRKRQAALYTHKPRPHVVRNANHVHKEHRDQAGINQKIAVFLTAYVGTMQTAYGFAALAMVGLGGVLTILDPHVYTLVAWFSQTFIQLVLLPVIMVGQQVLSKHAELQADEQYKAVMNTEHDSEQMIAHQIAEGQELLRQTAELLKQTPMLEEALHILRDLTAAAKKGQPNNGTRSAPNTRESAVSTPA